ncbi:E3 ubiquitin-protein ligase RNF31 [Motacilla alba alba]|uniref:E3 ubiquitin-protein ligase RNF31 n=1 Tax=Motacilla alba alba TaxID=1094192 RepID=UPI0018D55746|nr:E3 ubiquitin-protein ligase RNF31 [Motacilla alba alba]
MLGKGSSEGVTSQKGKPRLLSPSGRAAILDPPPLPEVMPDLPKDPPDLGSLQDLRAALEEALLRCPAEAEPPELRPVLRLPLPPTQKLKHLQGKRILCDNLEWNPGGLPRGLEQLRTALNILEKYGRNLLSPRPPRHWRGVRFGNPVFKSTVGAIQGGRAVLKLLGYTEESGEGLSFPPPPHGPHPPLVAAVTADVLVLRAELDLLLLNQHPNPHFFTQILLGGDEWPLASDAVPAASEVLPAGEAGPGRGWECRSCTFRNPAPRVLCLVCERPRLARRPQPSPAPARPWPCPRCTFLNPGHAPRCEMCGADHAPSGDITAAVTTPTPAAVSATSGFGAATSCSDPASSGLTTATSCAGKSTSGSSPASSGVTTTTSCAGKATSGSSPACSGVSKCTSGTADVTSGVSKTTPGVAASTSGVGNTTSGVGDATSGDPKLTFGLENTTSGSGNTTSGDAKSTSGAGNSTSGVEGVAGEAGNGTSGCAEATSGCGPAPSRDALRQRKLLEDGRRLVELVRAAESQGLPPESLGPAPFSALPEPSGPAPSPESQIRHFRSRLGGVLKSLLEAEPDQNGGGASLGPFSLAEAAWAWLEGEGQLDRARRVLIGRRKQQLRLLSSLGFPEAAPAAAALRRQQGSHWGALCELQRIKLRPFRLRQQQGAEPGLDFDQADQQALVRQILASLPVASWGRASLVAGLGRELGLGLLPAPSQEPLLAELVEAVGSCPDRAALRRRLRCECAVCGWGLPRQLMQWLPGCSCPLCPECFRLHFTVGLRERGVGALGCPSCGRPDLRDDAQRLWYWSTLEPAGVRGALG